LKREDLREKNEDAREADLRLANRRLQPLGHLTARLQVYAAQVLADPASFIGEGEFSRRVSEKPSPPAKPRINNTFHHSITGDRSDCMGTLLGTLRKSPLKSTSIGGPTFAKQVR